MDRDKNRIVGATTKKRISTEEFFYQEVLKAFKDDKQFTSEEPIFKFSIINEKGKEEWFKIFFDGHIETKRKMKSGLNLIPSLWEKISAIYLIEFKKLRSPQR